MRHGRASQTSPRGSRELVLQGICSLDRALGLLANRFRDLVQSMVGVYFAEAHFCRHERTDESFAVETAIHIVD